MKILSWNVRGIGNNKCLRNCREMFRNYKPDVLSLLETRCDESSVAEAFGNKLGFQQVSLLPSAGFAGGILVMWNESVNVQVIHSTFQVVHFMVSENNLSWVLSCSYVQPHCQMKELFWEEMTSFAYNLNLPWVVIGDFNDIASSEEKSGGAEFSANRAQQFLERSQGCDLNDIGASLGTKLTWSLRVNGRVILRERLNRAFRHSLALQCFPEAIPNDNSHWDGRGIMGVRHIPW